MSWQARVKTPLTFFSRLFGGAPKDVFGLLVVTGALALWTILSPWLPSFSASERPLELDLKPVGELGFDDAALAALGEKGEAWRTALGFNEPPPEEEAAPPEEETQTEAERLAAEALAARPQGGLGPLSAFLRATFIATEASARRFAVVEILEEGVPKFVELEEGNDLAGWEVTQIRRREVSFQRGDDEETLHLFPRPKPPEPELAPDLEPEPGAESAGLTDSGEAGSD